MRRLWHRFAPAIKNHLPRILEFVAIQGVVQALNAISGFMVVRTLSKHDYALFAVVNSMQTTCNMLADLGVGIGMRKLSGQVWNQPALLGSLLKQATALRFRFSIAVFSVCLPILAWMLWRNHAPLHLVAILTAVVFLYTLPILMSSPLGIVLQFHSQLRKIQGLDLAAAVFRFLAIAGSARYVLNAVLAVIIPVITNWVQLLFQRPWALKYVNMKAPLVPEHRRELLDLSLRCLPNMLYFCFQGQVTLLLLSYFGNATAIADLTALNRISAPLAVYTTVFATVAGPYFSRIQVPSRLAPSYFGMVGITAALFLPLPFIGTLFPAPFMWLIGAKYQSLSNECGLVLLVASISQVSGSLWCLNYGKGWIRYYQGWFIPATLTAQIAMFKLLDLNSTHGALMLSLGTALFPIPIYIADAIAGIRTARIEAANRVEPEISPASI